MREFRRGSVMMVFATVLALIVTACGNQASDGQTAASPDDGGEATEQSAEPDIIEVGVIAPLSGSAAGAGGDVERGVKLAQDVINESGMLGDAELRVIVEDDQSDPTAGANAAEKLYEREVRFFAGGAGSGTNEAILNVLARYDDVLSVGCGCSVEAIEKEFGSEDWTFFTHPWGYHYQEAAVGFLDTLDPAPERLAIMYEDGSYGTEQSALAKEYLADTGIEIVAEQPYNSEGTDFTPQLTKLKEANPDVLYIVGRTADSVLVTRQALTLGLDPKLIIGTPQLGTEEYFEAVGDQAAGVAFIAAWEPVAEYEASEKWPEVFMSSEEYVALFEETYGRAPTYLSLALGYVPVATIAAAIAETGSREISELSEFLANDFETMTPMGPLSFDPSRDAQYHGFSQMRIFQWNEDGTKSFVYPPGEATSDINYPVSYAG